MQLITYGYVEGGYVDFGYVVEYLGVSIEFRYSTLDPIVFARGFKYSSNKLIYFQTSEVTSYNFPFYTASKLSQITFDAIFPYMSDSEVLTLRTFMFTNLPAFETFEMAFVGRDFSRNAKFANRKLKVTQIQNNVNEVAIPIILL